MAFWKKSKEKQMAHYMAPQWIKIASDCTNLVNTTTKPEVFFFRYDLLVETVSNLASVEHFVKFNGTKPSKHLREYQASRDEQEKLFILRAYEKATNDAKKLKTEKGRLNKIQKLFNELDKYCSRLSSENRQLLEALKIGPHDFF